MIRLIFIFLSLCVLLGVMSFSGVWTPEGSAGLLAVIIMLFAFVVICASAFKTSMSRSDVNRAENTQVSSEVDLFDGGFDAQCERIRRLVEDNRISPDLGSLLLHYYAHGRNEASSERCDAANYAKSSFNPKHEEVIRDFRVGHNTDVVFRRN